LPPCDFHRAWTPRFIETRRREGVAHRRKGIAQLVTEHRQEFVFRTVRLLRFGAGTVGDRKQFLPFGLGAFSERDVAEDDRVEGLPFYPGLRNMRLDRKLLSVAAKRGQHTFAAHRPRAHPGPPELLDVMAVEVADGCGQKPIKRLSEHFRRRVAEDRLGGGVEHEDPLGAIKRDDGVGRGRDDALEARLGVAERVFAVPSLGDVAEDEHRADDATIVVANRGAAVVDRTLGAVRGDQHPYGSRGRPPRRLRERA